MYKCLHCDYTSKRNYFVNRHMITKHSKEDVDEISDEEYKNKIREISKQSFKGILPDTMFCPKCDKKFITTHHLMKHLLKCNGIHVLTCPSCMSTFESIEDKRNHINNNSTCKLSEEECDDLYDYNTDDLIDFILKEVFSMKYLEECNSEILKVIKEKLSSVED